MDLSGFAKSSSNVNYICEKLEQTVSMLHYNWKHLSSVTFSDQQPMQFPDFAHAYTSPETYSIFILALVTFIIVHAYVSCKICSS